VWLAAHLHKQEPLDFSIAAKLISEEIFTDSFGEIYVSRTGIWAEFFLDNCDDRGLKCLIWLRSVS
jgi:hypothetical protein